MWTAPCPPVCDAQILWPKVATCFRPKVARLSRCLVCILSRGNKRRSFWASMLLTATFTPRCLGLSLALFCFPSFRQASTWIAVGFHDVPPAADPAPPPKAHPTTSCRVGDLPHVEYIFACSRRFPGGASRANMSFLIPVFPCVAASDVAHRMCWHMYIAYLVALFVFTPCRDPIVLHFSVSQHPSPLISQRLSSHG